MLSGFHPIGKPMGFRHEFITGEAYEDWLYEEEKEKEKMINTNMFVVKAKIHEKWKKENPDWESDWAEGCLIIAENRSNEMRYKVQPVEGNYMYAFPIDPETICRPTGQKDKCDQPIYEHDLCFVEGGGVDYEDGLFEALWDEETSRFVLSGTGLVLDFDNTYGYECTVMGNAYDTPGLAKEEKEVE